MVNKAIILSITLPTLIVLLRESVDWMDKVLIEKRNNYSSILKEFSSPEEKLKTTIYETPDIFDKYGHYVKCIKISIEEYRKHMVYGFEDLNITIQDPAVPEEDFFFHQEFPGGLATIYMKRCRVLGLSNFVVRNIVVDVENHFIRYDFYYPKIPLVGVLKIVVEMFGVATEFSDKFVGFGENVTARVVTHFDCDLTRGATLKAVDVSAIVDGDVSLNLQINPYFADRFLNGFISVKQIFNVYKQVLENMFQKNLYIHGKDFLERYHLDEYKCEQRNITAL